ncbi:hypothetical protein QKU48_gp1148 [Fadolivirus algeromassiliense]|jgi:hypothetical protein|uniref:Uncharacterized protein n=1 Tax=Fadolivirus FV1/VV64 TaxID=3070911 RepID=A0A7D3QWH9_9VIRU|nr:hypothetical protein QKU48_gp1148 [Fadolivirus algeromassiliense]QKF94606.1 hypothetical protein Fadolivirus_1_1148 [Fadolivirus FV1/VV64]
MKIFDLNYNTSFGNNVQKNILNIKKNFGNKFIIRDGDIELPSFLYQVKEDNNPKMQYYSLIYDIKERDSFLLPFKINFIDIIKLITKEDNNYKNNNCYIANIHKVEGVSGTSMVNTLLKFLKIIGVEQIILHDGARILCENNGQEIDLSFFKLIEKGITFYQKFGFKFLMDPGNAWHMIDFGNTDNMTKQLHIALDNVYKIKLDYYKNAYIKLLDIINQTIKEQDYDNVKIYLYHPYKPYILKKEHNREKLISMVHEIDTLLNIIKLSNKTYLYETMIDTFYSDCNVYIQLEDIIFNNLFMGISYKRKGVYLKHNDTFHNLRYIRNSAMFELNLN